MKFAPFQSKLYTNESPNRSRLISGGWIEIILLVALAVLLTIASRQFEQLPALSALPLTFLALRKGSSAAVFACLMWLLLCGLLQNAMGNAPNPLSLNNLAPILLSLLCGYFSDYWRENQLVSETANQHNTQLLDEITQSHHLLQLSHARLEQRVVSGVDTLRESLQRLHTALIESAEKELPLSSRGADMLLQFDSLTWVQSASLYMVSSNARVIEPAAAEIGDPPSLDSQHPLVLEAISQQKMLTVADYRFKSHLTGPLAVAPIVDTNGYTRAIVCLHKVPFLSFNKENLGLLAVLAAHIGHVISITEQVGAGNSLELFKHTLHRACKDSQTFSIPSTLVQWTFQQTQMASDTARFIRDNVRGLDHSLLESINGAERLTLLCSLTNRSEFESLIERLRQLLSTQHAIELADNIVEYKVHAINSKDKPESLLKQMCLQPND